MKSKNIPEIDMIKFIAAIFVVWIHCCFPGVVGYCVMNVGQFAVPFFFMISGFFMNIDSPFSTYLRKIKKLSIIFLISSIIYLCLDFLMHSTEPSLILSVKGVLKFILLNDTGFIKYHLWFLMALIYTYFLIYILYKFLGDKIYYYVLLSLLFWPVGISIFHAATGITVPFIVFRNFLFDGAPAFLIGSFFRKKEQVINEKISLPYLIAGLASTIILQLCLTYFKLGFTDAGFMLIAVVVLFFCVYFKNNPSKVRIRIPSDMSLMIYLVHPFFISVLSVYFPSINEWIKPVLVVVLSIVAAFAYSYLISVRTMPLLLQRIMKI